MNKEKAIEVLRSRAKELDVLTLSITDAAEALATAGAFTDEADVRDAVAEYRAALERREHGGTAGARLIERVLLIADTASSRPHNLGVVAPSLAPNAYAAEIAKCRRCGEPEGKPGTDCEFHMVDAGKPSRPVANGASVPHPGWISLRTGEPVRHSSESRPVATEAGASKVPLFWHCDCGANEPAQPEYEHGDSEPCCLCEDGVARVVTLEEAAAWEQRIALRASRPIAAGSKARAEEILKRRAKAVRGRAEVSFYDSGFDLIQALDRAQFFADPATLAEIEALRLLREWRGSNPERCFEIRCLESGETRDPWAVRLERESVGWSHEEVAFDDLLRCVQFALREAAKAGEA